MSYMETQMVNERCEMSRMRPILTSYPQLFTPCNKEVTNSHKRANVDKHDRKHFYDLIFIPLPTRFMSLECKAEPR